MKKFLITILLVLFGFTAFTQDYNIKVDRITFFSYPSDIINVENKFIDSIKFNESFVHFATVKIDLKNKLIVCGEINGLKTISTAFDVVSVNNDGGTTLDIVGKDKTGKIHFKLLNEMLIVSFQKDTTIYGWFDRNIVLD